MRGVVRHLGRQPRPRVPLLVARGEVRQAVQLVEDRHHVRGPRRVVRDADGEGGAEEGVGGVGGEVDVAAGF